MIIYFKLKTKTDQIFVMLICKKLMRWTKSETLVELNLLKPTGYVMEHKV